MNPKILPGIAIFILACAFSSAAQMTAYANIYAEVIAPVGIGKSTDLAINQTIAGQKGGSGTAASFTVTGSSLNTFNVTLPAHAKVINNNLTDYMTISNFTSPSTLTSDALQINSRVISISAILKANGNQAVGEYCAQDSFQVTLNYN